ncbi:MAG: hypothetical protein GY696_30920 [Gammaproteobacteria bacterium]|nr:hypothetical protein [Gammaproteobacteria bacterium]
MSSVKRQKSLDGNPLRLPMRTRPAVTRSGSGLAIQRSVLAEAAQRKSSRQQKIVRKPPRHTPIPTVVEPPPQVQQEEFLQPADDAPMLTALLQFRNEQLDFQEEIRSSIGSLPSQESAPNPPKLISPDFAKQQEFNLGVISALNSIKLALKTDRPALIGEVVDKELRRVKSRNSQLVMADRFPGSLSIMESLQDLADLKNDPDCAPFLSEALHFYANQQHGMVPFSGNRAPQSVIGPCNFCHAFGHLRRNCVAKAQFDSGQVTAISAQDPHVVLPPSAIAWSGGNFGGPAAPQQYSQ